MTINFPGQWSIGHPISVTFTILLIRYYLFVEYSVRYYAEDSPNDVMEQEITDGNEAILNNLQPQTPYTILIYSIYKNRLSEPPALARLTSLNAVSE